MGGWSARTDALLGETPSPPDTLHAVLDELAALLSAVEKAEQQHQSAATRAAWIAAMVVARDLRAGTDADGSAVRRCAPRTSAPVRPSGPESYWR